MSDLLTGQGCTLSPEPCIQDFPHEDVNEGPGSGQATCGWEPREGGLQLDGTPSLEWFESSFVSFGSY